MSATTQRRLRKERVQMVMDAAVEAAQKAGARVRINPTTGEAVIDFPAIVGPIDDEEGARLDAAMKAAMGGKR
jgi:pyrimidine deaminase RibD-like protein